MLQELDIRNVGPAPRLKLDFGERFNVLTGDNGLGKSFVLDVAWWALARTWVDGPAWPDPRQHQGDAVIQYSMRTSSRERAPFTSKYTPETRCWSQPQGRPPNPPCLVIYAQVDGGFSLRDPNRNYWVNLESREHRDPDRPLAFHFGREAIWDGLKHGERTICNGLVDDWVLWQLKNNDAYRILQQVLEVLSPCPTEIIEIDQPEAFIYGDTREYPFVRLPYGRVPVVHASAGMRRILALAYALVWGWTEHLRASSQLKLSPVNDIVFILDEIEAHLHPQWQRVILPALLKAAQCLGAVRTQFIATTHSPLVMASLETIFDTDKDKVFTFDLEDGQVEVRDVPWAPHGEMGNWLVSDVFGLKKARSLEAEKAIEAAEAFMRHDFDVLPKELRNTETIHEELLRVLPDGDSFWPRWLVKTGRVGA